MYRYKVSVVKVVDGDTVDVDIDLGFGMSYKKQRVRMLGIDTPRVVEQRFPIGPVWHRVESYGSRDGKGSASLPLSPVKT